MKNDKALNFMVPQDLYNRLKEEADSKCVSVASIVRMACSEYLEKKEKKKTK